MMSSSLSAWAVAIKDELRTTLSAAAKTGFFMETSLSVSGVGCRIMNFVYDIKLAMTVPVSMSEREFFVGPWVRGVTGGLGLRHSPTGGERVLQKGACFCSGAL